MESSNEYWKSVCETDAAWELFCEFASEVTWKAYVEAKEVEDKTKKEQE